MTTATVTPIARKRTARAAAKPAADDKPSLTAEQINEQTTAARLAAAKGSASSSARNVTGTNAKPAGTKPAAAKGSTTTKPAAAAKGKPAGKPAAKPAPAKTANTVVGSAVIKAAADLIASWVPAEHEGISKADAAALAGRWLSYLPTSAEWDKRLGTRSDAGRRRAS